MPVVATDDYGSASSGLVAPYAHAAVLTKSDTDELTKVSRALYVGGTGNINVVTAAGETVLFSAIPVGTLLPIRIKQLLSTNTTATLVVALW
ncbi:spike base protein, RCAP_Rcc01079 family [Zavarzinella formosa]|uniref:spike base protein, RCAP_Rcc01079 family n=1 Tax=Zavarzinella formosa TaxID=360055 RepID=UPI0002F56DD4|nr:hypothetical protein [Zavarzinella formosa]